MFWENKKRNICFVIKVARPISFNNLSMNRTEISDEQMINVSMNRWKYFNSKFVLGIPSASSFRSVLWSAISSLFHSDLFIFLPYQTENLFKSLKQWKKLVGI